MIAYIMLMFVVIMSGANAGWLLHTDASSLKSFLVYNLLGLSIWGLISVCLLGFNEDNEDNK